MLVKLEGYNIVEFDDSVRSFVCVSVSTDKCISYGTEYLNVVLSRKYWDEKIYPAFNSHVPVHVGFDKKKYNKPFLYVKG